MKKKNHNKTSLRTHFIIIVIFCWLLPILIVIVSGVFLLNRDYDRSMRQEMELRGSYALEQTAARFAAVFEESKSVSYDGIVRSAYRAYQLNQDKTALYRTVSSYLNQRFSHSQPVRAAFLRFWNLPDIHPYVSGQPDDRSRTVWNQYSEIENEILEATREADTRILLLQREDRLYVCRNLLDSQLKPYATVVILCDNDYLAEPLDAMSFTAATDGLIDGGIRYAARGVSDNAVYGSGEELRYETETDGHTLTIRAWLRRPDLLADLPDLKLPVLCVVLLVVPMLVVLCVVYSRHVSRPVQTLVQATARVQDGDRGYIIGESGGSREFDTLYRHFNTMSAEMRRQFDQALQEQQALQQARVKALQSQINPHFLNNTLEIINWEARIAGNDRIAAMIEALSTMLAAALNRDSASRIPLREEMTYVNAYLYIIRERMGDKLKTSFDIAENMYDRLIPRLILQPVVENAVEHDISHGGEGRLEIRAEERDGMFALEVIHSGTLTEEDREKIRIQLEEETELSGSGHIGIRNVHQRLRLLYGEKAGLTVEEQDHGVIAARISFPSDT